ncbi:hypothetical protein ACLB2K_027839 [Fragaria x ananassa]
MEENQITVSDLGRDSKFWVFDTAYGTVLILICLRLKCIMDDIMIITEVYGMMMGINRSYAGKKIDYYYSIGSEEDIVTKLNNDGDVLMMCCCVPRVRLVILYLDHRYLDPENIDHRCADNVILYNGEKSSVGVEELLASHNRLPDSSKKHKRYKRCANRQCMTALKLNEPQDEIPTQTSKAPTIDPSDKGKKKKEDDYEDEFGSDCEDAFEDGVDYNPAKGDDEYAGYGVDDDFLFNWLTEPEGDVNKGVYQYKLDADEDEVIEVEDEEAMFEAVDSDEEGIGPEYNSDDGFEVDKFPEFNPKTDMKSPCFFKGLKFATARILRAALRERAIQDGWEVLFNKSDSDRIHAICKADNCDFELRATRMQHESTLLVRKYIGCL